MFTRIVVASIAEDKSIPLILSGPSVDTGDAAAQAVSPSGKLTVVLRSVPGEKKKHFVEVNISCHPTYRSVLFDLQLIVNLMDASFFWFCTDVDLVRELYPPSFGDHGDSRRLLHRLDIRHLGMVPRRN
jgi:hypothetical protein